MRAYLVCTSPLVGGAEGGTAFQEPAAAGVLPEECGGFGV
jgi:hypothetical protein